MNKKLFTKRIMQYEVIGFGLVILILWVDEVLDLPSVLLGAKPTPVNWVESIFESAVAVLLCLFIVFSTRKILQHVKYLEGFIQCCAFCKRVKVGESWIPIEEFIRDQSDAVFSHGLCPDCVEKHYKGFFLKMRAEKEKDLPPEAD
ncbi:MAG: hypothetical protein JXQ83_06415 [Candidatus Glassbacteria bacterium]|nr:hypothetical protein [Candidatus Glassbacteria bacterium]